MKKMAMVVSTCVILAFAGSIAFAEIKVGMLAQRGSDTAVREWGALANHLSETLGEEVVLVPLKFTEFMEFVKTERDAFIFTNPWFFVRSKVIYGAHALVTVKYENSGTMFGGVIFAKKGSGITSIQDISDKTLMCPKFSSPGGWLFQRGVIEQHGINPVHDLKLLLETPNESHDDVVYAVRDGKADVGTVRTNLLETMEREGKIRMADFVILNQMEHEGFPEASSTPLYPDWPVAALGQTPPEKSARMKQALLSIPAGHPALRQARHIERFVEPLDYDPVEKLCRDLKVKPFAKLHRQQKDSGGPAGGNAPVEDGDFLKPSSPGPL